MAAETQGPDMSSRKHTAVVVNDTRTQLVLTSALLERNGYEVRSFLSAAEALSDMTNSGAPDVIVTDLHMPEIDGWRFCRLLKSHEYASLNDVPIIVVSATFSGIEAGKITADLGAQAFLPQPSQPGELLACVADVIEGRAVESGETVLIVEDGPTFATFLAKTFEAPGFESHIATDCAQARALFREVDPGIVLLDYHLPDGLGDQLLKEFKNKESGTVVIMMTTDATPELAAQFMRMGADAYVRKPADGEYLIDLCRAARRQRALLRVEDLLEERTQELRASQELFRRLFEGIPELVIVRDGTGLILQVNHYAEELLNWPQGELDGKSVTELLSVDTSPSFSKLWQEPVAEARRFEAIFQTRDGRILDVEVNDRPFEFQGRQVVLSVARDISDRKYAEDERQRLEVQLFQAQKMEAIGRLAGGVAHDFNNLLTGIMGCANILRVERAGDAFVMETSETIQSASERAADLTQRLLGFARRGKYQEIHVDLHGTIQDVLRLLSHTLDKNISLEQSLRAERAVVLGDPGQLQQVILNLAVNGRDAMPEGGTLTFETDVVDLDDEFCRERPGAVPGRYVAMAVRDTGVGIPEENRRLIFEPFFTTKDKSVGTGMGLAMVYGIVKNHGGYIGVDSVEGQGTTFRAYLPPAKTSEVPALEPAQTRVVTGTGRIMIVDDEPLVLKVGGQMLRALGYEVVCAPGGAEAVDMYREDGQHIDLVLLDMMMPGMDGRECFHALREINPDIKVILSTGFGRDGKAQELLDEGIRGFVQKPYRLAHLSVAIANVLQGQGGP